VSSTTSSGTRAVIKEGAARLHPDTIGARILRAADEHGTLQAVSDGEASLDFAQLADSAFEVAAALIATGVAPGDRIAVWAPNSHHWIRVAIGAYAAGAVVVPVNTRYRGVEARELAERTGVRVAVVADGFLGYGYTDALVGEGAPPQGLGLVVDVSGAPVAERTGGVPVVGWEAFLTAGREVDAATVLDRLAAVSPDDLSDIIFTSGTTGRPKGVRVTHGPAIHLYEEFGRIWGLRPGDRHLLSLPMFTCGGLKAGILLCLLHAATQVPLAVFDIERVMEVVDAERINALNGPPTVHYAVLDADRARYDLTSLRLGATGAANVPVAMVRRVQDELTYENFITAYGMTECIGTATMCRRDDSAETVAATNGRALPGVEIRVVDRADTPLPAGEQGEVHIRGFHVTPGYWDSPDEGAVVTEDGWLRTGDIGRLDEHGNLDITDRLKDMFTVGGFNVAPAEVEHALREHPAIGDVAVIGVPDVRLGEVGHAFVMRSSGAELDTADLIAWSRERMANFKVPRLVTFVETLPRTPSGKVVKTQLREEARTTAGPPTP